jgi:ferric-chelate reductase (NADPH)
MWILMRFVLTISKKTCILFSWQSLSFASSLDISIYRSRRQSMMTKTKADKYPQRVRNELRFRELTVLRVERAGAAFQRIVLGGEALEGFASHGFDDHTKLFSPSRARHLPRRR